MWQYLICFQVSFFICHVCSLRNSTIFIVAMCIVDIHVCFNVHALILCGLQALDFAVGFCVLFHYYQMSMVSR